MARPEAFGQDDPVQAEDQVDDQLGGVAASGGPEEEHALGERVEQRRVLGAVLPVADDGDRVAFADLAARAHQRAIDEANAPFGEEMEVPHGFLGVRGRGVDDQGTRRAGAGETRVSPEHGVDRG